MLTHHRARHIITARFGMEKASSDLVPMHPDQLSHFLNASL